VLGRLLALKVHKLPHSRHGAFITYYVRELRVFQDVVDRVGLIIDQDDIAHEPDSVAVIRIVRAVNCAEGLNRNA